MNIVISRPGKQAGWGAPLRWLAGLTFLLGISAGAATYQWTNTLGGDWSVAANWSPNGVPGTNDAANITTPGTYTLTATNHSSFSAFKLGAASGTQTLLYGSSTTCFFTNQCTVTNHGVLAVTNASLQGNLTIEAGGELQLTGATYKYLYDFRLVNRGTVTWSGGALNFGGTYPATTVVTNSGLWQITGDSSIGYGGGPTPTWVNAGTLRKSGGTATTALNGLNFVNLPGGLVDVQAGTLTINGGGTNVLGGNVSVIAPGLLNLMGTWTDAGGIISGTGTNQFTTGTLLLRTNVPSGLRIIGGDVYLASTFQQSGAITNLTLDGATLHGTNKIGGGTLTFNSGNLVDQLTVLPAGQLVFATSASKLLYSSTIINQGTVNWTAGGLNVGTTTISNGGLWQIAGDLQMSYGGSATPNWTNTGILRKTAGTGQAWLSGINFINQSGGLVDAQSGVIRFGGGVLSRYGGTFNAAAGCQIDLLSGTWSDAGGVATGAGSNRLNGATLNLQTNLPAGLKLVAGSVYVTGTNTFQQAGAITNLVLEGVSLLGTNTIGNGTLTVNSGSLAGQLTVSANGQLALATPTGKVLYGLSLFNQGTVLWGGGGLSVGGTPTTVVVNQGLWQATSDDAMSYGGGQSAVWTNSGTLRKTAGTGVSSVAGLSFYNQPGGLVQVDTGTLQLTSVTTNSAGTLRLNGGQLLAAGTLASRGGTVDGSGTLGANALSGGLIAPGIGGAGLIKFSSGLNLSANATLVFDGTGTIPGTSYDQLSVTGAVVLGSCTLQVTALPAVATGTTFVLVENDGAEAVSGTFNGLAENALVPVGGQLFRLSYHGGTGNDVTLTRAANANAQPVFSNLKWLGDGTLQLAATGSAGLTYTVQANTNLATTNWLNRGVATADSLGSVLYQDAQATNAPARFYRLVWP